ncbi:hypothetical protein WI74_26625 [Burkholderia ubonensis]|nr:hypothetical protein WI74_26625 [Burkholderia ubonensis]
MVYFKIRRSILFSYERCYLIAFLAATLSATQDKCDDVRITIEDSCASRKTSGLLGCLSRSMLQFVI